jgi:ferredoxin-type protein NapH
MKAGGYTRVDLLYRTETGVSVDTAVQWLSWASVVGLLLIPAFFLGRRSFCHYFCPWGVLNMLVTRLRDALRVPGLRLSAQPDKCQACGTCTANCPMTLPVQDMVKAGRLRHRECILCGTCADNCPHRVIEYGWRRVNGG